MMLRVDLYGKLPKAWSDYISHNPGVSVVSQKPLVLDVRESKASVQGIVSALGRLRVPARAVYIEPRRSPGYAVAAH